MKTLSSLVRLCLQGLAVAAFVSCGGGGGGEPDHPPSISALRYSPATVLQIPNGTVTINGAVDFTDGGGDITALRMVSSGGVDLTVPTPALSGVKTGTGVGAFVVSVDQVGKYTFEVWMTDSQGSSSNRLSGTFEVLPAAQPHPPSVSNLSYSPATALHVPGGSVTINGTIDFADSGGDISSMRLVSSAGVDLTVPTPALSGISSGTATMSFAVSADVVGKYTFEVWALDSLGAASNHLSGTFEVLPAAPDHPPAVSNLRYSPANALQAPGGTVTIDGAVDFADSGGDVAALRVVSSAGLDLTLPTPALSGIKSGTATMSFVVSVDVVGKYTFEVWAVDGLGAASNHLSGSFEVLPQDTTGSWIRLAVAPPYKLFGVDFSGQKYVAVGMHGTVMTSSDVDHWTLQASGVNHTLHSVASSPVRFVAVGDNAIGEAVVISSTDATTWSVQYRSAGCLGSTCPAPAMLSKVIWTGTQFVAVGQERDATTAKLYALILTSVDGTTWTQRAPKAIELGGAFPGDPSMTSVAWSGSLLVATGLDPALDPAVWVSTDAVVWTYVTLPTTAVWMAPWSDVTWGNGRFVAVGRLPDFNGDNPVFTSIDGINWQTDLMSTNLPAMNAVTTGANEYLAVGGTHRQTSPDGRLWTVFELTGCGSDVIWDGSHYVAVGETICRSP